MKASLFLLILGLTLTSCTKPSYKKNEIIQTEEEFNKEIVENQKLSADEQIASAVLAAPIEGRGEATVYGYNEAGDFILLREGTNEFICIADDPNKDGVQVVCYHKSLEPMMSRGRELDASGVSRQEKEEIRAAAAKSGEMPLPESPAALHIYYGNDAYFDTESGTMKNAKYRYVVYMPYATQETTGLSLAPNESSHPWLMFPGQYNAHIMITPNE